ncbi:MAG: hypothetical protein US68_C0003G0010 [Candidatus Shapirobacteria bacterium GW2011_GWE1_38_10]|uniref:Uncharacterized protein n=1 Tax=Candidatus Shapirobacteria bacterium GW2011_GWE1_38_10 TaxID=1618488 RepID=A0A0G0KN99_9BACT|nr:MAG: hypothetical protein US46_C0012G0017 [Candidatus Shapirobacteria bacterium GW2011_GWF2_37_20]KKQ50644.1 MAG: hypothetical protein US68_C0003G0010 [Candidatus Shapirobacteria bacterium GW2011_GWE1_38_10]KKQ62615.1 MAG: hypothetical protein US85_C0024G0014 [Candidatus Shapirobacteria bacterium GW2011_GWF1_38_23]HBP51445.1 hypothetical protein [Candidatus Shapirobacteria bacterium]
MIANPKWFSPRKYSGWGLTPNCWQGWAYIALIALPIIVISNLSLPASWSTIFIFIWATIFSLDFIHIFINMKKDERDIAHEAIAERNAMWFIVTALALGIAYQASISVVKNSYQVDPVILIALIGATIVKAITNFYLRNK